MAKRELTPKQKAFIEEYLVDLNATQAAIRAGYSAKTAKEQGYRLFTNVHIQESIAEAQAARVERTHITQDQVLRELAAIGLANLTDVATWDGDTLTILPSDGLTDAAKASVKEVAFIETNAGTRMVVKQHDKVAALDKIGKHLGMFENTTNLNLISMPDGFDVEIVNAKRDAPED